jgi:hypothetical protein
LLRAASAAAPHSLLRAAPRRAEAIVPDRRKLHAAAFDAGVATNQRNVSEAAGAARPLPIMDQTIASRLRPVTGRTNAGVIAV